MEQLSVCNICNKKYDCMITLEKQYDHDIYTCPHCGRVHRKMGPSPYLKDVAGGGKDLDLKTLQKAIAVVTEKNLLEGFSPVYQIYPQQLPKYYLANLPGGFERKDGRIISLLEKTETLFPESRDALLERAVKNLVAYRNYLLSIQPLGTISLDPLFGPHIIFAVGDFNPPVSRDDEYWLNAHDILTHLQSMKRLKFQVNESTLSFLIKVNI